MRKMAMDFDHAVKVVKNFGEGSLLRGLLWMKTEMGTTDNDGNPFWLTDAQADAYYTVCREMKKQGLVL